MQSLQGFRHDAEVVPGAVRDRDFLWPVLTAGRRSKTPRGFDLASKSFVNRDFASAGVVVHVDTREFEAIGRALQRFDAKRQDRIMVAVMPSKSLLDRSFHLAVTSTH